MVDVIVERGAGLMCRGDDCGLHVVQPAWWRFGQSRRSNSGDAEE
jgi:hypothetical protein